MPLENFPFPSIKVLVSRFCMSLLYSVPIFILPQYVLHSIMRNSNDNILSSVGALPCRNADLKEDSE